MSERVSSLVILLTGALALTVLWILSILTVRWDSRRRRLSEAEQRAWLALTVLLPLLGFALYLVFRVLRRYFQPQLGGSQPDDARLTAVRARAYRPPEDYRGRDLPQQAWGQAPIDRSNGSGARQAQGLPATAVAVAQRPLRTGFTLVVLQGPHLGQQFILNQLPALIGRGPDVSIPLDADLNVSRRHAELYEWNGRLRVRDLQSTHGTRVNDVVVSDQPLSSGDRITVGGTVIILRDIAREFE